MVNLIIAQAFISFQSRSLSTDLLGVSKCRIRELFYAVLLLSCQIVQQPFLSKIDSLNKEEDGNNIFFPQQNKLCWSENNI